jgi:hypothetical protein
LIVQLFISRENHLPPTMRPNQSDNGYSGGEDRRKIIRQWLREQEQDRESRERRHPISMASGPFLTQLGHGEPSGLQIDQL